MLARLGQLEGAKSSQPSTSTSPDQNGDNSLPSTSASSNNEANSAATNSRQNDVKIKTEPSSSVKQNVHQTTSNGGSRKSSQDGRTPSPSKLHVWSISNHTETLKQGLFLSLDDQASAKVKNEPSRPVKTESRPVKTESRPVKSEPSKRPASSDDRNSYHRSDSNREDDSKRRRMSPDVGSKRPFEDFLIHEPKGLCRKGQEYYEKLLEIFPDTSPVYLEGIAKDYAKKYYERKNDRAFRYFCEDHAKNHDFETREKWETEMSEIAFKKAEEAGLKNLERCIFCPFFQSMKTTTEENTVFKCRRCQRKHCRLCKRDTYCPRGCITEKIDKEKFQTKPFESLVDREIREEGGDGMSSIDLETSRVVELTPEQIEFRFAESHFLRMVRFFYLNKYVIFILLCLG